MFTIPKSWFKGKGSGGRVNVTRVYVTMASRRKRGFCDFTGDVPAPDQVSQSSRGFEACLDRAMAIGDRIVGFPKLPWEVGFANDVLSPECSWLSSPVIPRNLTAVPICIGRPVESLHEKKRIAQRKFYEQKAGGGNPKRQEALNKWLQLILLYPVQSRLGQHLISDSVKDESTFSVGRLLEDWFAKKSTSTLMTRAGSFALFVAFSQKHFPDRLVLPIQEDVVYAYVDNIRETGKPPTRAQTFVSTLKFVAAELGWPGAEDAASSNRVLGSAHLSFLRKRVLRQAPPLKVVAIFCLELCSCFDKDVYMQACAGLCLFALYGRLRTSDCNRISHGQVQGSFFEGSLCRTKTSRTLEKQTRFLPVVIPTQGLSGLAWFQAFLGARRKLCLEDIPEQAPHNTENEFVLFPSMRTLSADIQEGIGSAELSERLAECLAKLLPNHIRDDHTSHSLKCTLLTFTNMFGIPFEHNELLGYHVVKGHSSALNYARDALSQPINSLTAMLLDISNGLFCPDNPRDRRVVPADEAVSAWMQFEAETGHSVSEACRQLSECEPDSPEAFVVAEQIERLQGRLSRDRNQYEPSEAPEENQQSDPDLSDSDSTSDSGSTSCEESMAHVENALFGDVRSVSEFADDTRVFRNVRTKMLHYARIYDMHKTSCGRVVSDGYTLYTQDVDRAWPKCRLCFGT